LGCTDRRVQVFTLKNKQLELAVSLEGHEDWIRCLAVVPYPSADETNNTSDLLIASGSQDNYIRLWRISPFADTTNRAENDAPVAHGDGLDMLDEFERKLAGAAGYGGSMQISTKAHVIAVEDGTRSVSRIGRRALG
jgi:elongator complex protein 2